MEQGVGGVDGEQSATVEVAHTARNNLSGKEGVCAGGGANNGGMKAREKTAWM